MDAKLGRNPSFIWRSLLAGRKLMEKGLTWPVGNCKKTKIWRDPWLVTFCPWTQNCLSSTNSKWNYYCIRAYPGRPTELEPSISTTSVLSRWNICYPNNSSLFNDKRDKLTWNYTKNGKHNVKSTYLHQTIQARNTCSSSRGMKIVVHGYPFGN